jgi:hypothetical protein
VPQISTNVTGCFFQELNANSDESAIDGMGIVRASETEDPGSNPARVQGFWGKIAILLCVLD